MLDLTRVIAGPVGTRMLAALGAEVLRIDPPHRPELPIHAIDGVIGKASATLDARTEHGRELLHRLLEEADVLVSGYRPGALRHLGLEPEQVAERHPGTVIVTLSAWGTSGEWGRRRGFDSLVQVATGIGWAESADGRRPGALPCQLLDHATGYLTAAAVLAGLVHRHRTGEAVHAELALARTARWLLDQGPRRPGSADFHHPEAAVEPFHHPEAAVEPFHRPEGAVEPFHHPEARADAFRDPERAAEAFRVALGNGWSGISPPGRLDGRGLAWPGLPPAYGQAQPQWKSARP